MAKQERVVSRDAVWSDGVGGPVRVGDVVPLEGRRPVSDLPCDPSWFIFVARPMQDRGLAIWLDRVGAAEVWRPVETRSRLNRRARGGKLWVPVEVSVAPGYVFAMFDRVPVWHVLHDMAGSRLRGVVSRNGWPVVVPEGAMAEMTLVPSRLAQMQAEAEARRAAEALAQMPVPGEAARLTSGPLAGIEVTVERIHAGVAYFLHRGFTGSADVAKMKRVDG